MVGKGKSIVFLLLSIIVVIAGWYFFNTGKKREKKEKESSVENFVQQNQPTGPLVTIFRKEYDLEKLDGIVNPGLISKSVACSGTQSSEMNPEIEYGINLEFPLENIPGGSNLLEAKISAAVLTEDAGEAQWVLEIRDQAQKILFWNSVLIAPGKHNWDTLEFSFALPIEHLNSSHSLKFYPWNKSLKSLWIDNINLRLIGTASGIRSSNRDFKKVNYFLSYEEGEELTDEGCITEDIARTGNRSTFLKGNDSYSNSFTKTIREITEDTLRRVSLGVWIYPEQKNPFLMLVVTIKNASGQTVFWEGRSSEKLEFSAKKWQKYNAEIAIPPDKRKEIKPDDEVVIYLWNRSPIKVYADDLEIVYGDELTKRGLLPYADMNLSSRENYTFDRLHGPFRINYLNNIQLNNTGYLVKDGNQKFGNFFPTDEIITLNSAIIQSDLLLSISNNKFELFRWCAEAAKFIFLGQSNPFALLEKSTKLFSIDHDGDGSSEVLAVNETKSSLYKLNPTSSSSCSNTLDNLSCNVVWEGEFDSDNYLLVNDFNGDGKEDILSVDISSQKWDLINFQNKGWVILASGNFPVNCFSRTSAVSAGHFIPSNKNTQLLIAYDDNLKDACLVFEFNKITNSFKEISGPKDLYLTQIFSSGMKLFNTNVDDDVQDELLIFNRNWQFDMKLIDCDSKGFYVSSSVDFKGYQNSCNPKYYEIVKPLVGKFTDTNHHNILMVLNNCADKKYDGNSCSTYGGSPDLPDQIQLYDLKLYY
ncbi:MAG: hypothetical protein EYC69_05625 [Bacteroidetes bacterium]|nr:MAG: hypothetical protein EYC69_05625 [Bacteroidota bacterium]